MKRITWLIVLVAVIAMTASAYCAELEIGKTSKDAYGIKGFDLTRIAVPEYGWWPRWCEFDEYTYSDGTVKISGVIVHPGSEAGMSKGTAPYPAVIVNHGHEGYAKEFSMEYGWHFAINGFVAIACNYTHSLNETVETEKTNKYPWKTDENIKRAKAVLSILERLPFVNKDRLYMYGHSQGGAFTTLFVGETDKLKAAATTAGGLRGTPDDDAIAKKVSCPMLIMHGTADTLDPEVSIKLYQELKRQNKPAKIFLFEGEPHQVIHYRTRDIFDLIIPFFNTYGGK